MADSYSLEFPDGLPSQCPLSPQHEARVIDDLRRQLAARPPTPPELWGNDPLRRRVAGVIAEVVEEICGWPARRLRPWDPFKLVLIEDVADIDVGIAIDQAFAVELDPGIWAGLYDLTFLHAVDAIVARIRAAGGGTG